MSEELSLKERLQRASDAMVRRARTAAFGDSSSEVDQQNRAAATVKVPRTDNPGLEVTEHFLMCLRSLFAQNHEWTWVGDGTGRTDVRKSRVVIESDFSRDLEEENLNLPYVRVRPGPTSSMQTHIGGVKHFDFETGSTTYTGLDAGSMQLTISHPAAARAQTFANHLKKFLVANENELRAQRIHLIDNINVGGYEKNNPLYNRTVGKSTHAVIPVTFMFYYQWTMRNSPRPGTYERLFSGRFAAPGASADAPRPENQRPSARPPEEGEIVHFSDPFDG